MDRSFVTRLAVSIALLSSVAAAQQPFGTNFRVNTITTGNQTLPAMTMHPVAGTFLVVWNNGNAAKSQFYGLPGEPVGTEETALASGQSPAVAPYKDGGFVVVGVTSSQIGAAVAGRLLDSAGVPAGSDFPVNDATLGTKSGARVASDATGGFVVVWTSSAVDGAGDGVAARRFLSTGAPAALQWRVNTTTTGHQRSASVARAQTGEFVVVWQSGPTQFGVCCAQVFGQRFDSNGAPAGGEFRVATPTNVGNYNPDVAMDAAGDFVVVWTSLNNYGAVGPGDNENVHGQRYSSSGVPEGAIFRVNRYTTGTAVQPRVTRNQDGYLVVWSEADVDGSGLAPVARLYASSGPSITGGFRPSVDTTGDQTAVVAGSRLFGDARAFVIVWSGYHTGTHNFEIGGQHYCDKGDASGDGVPDVADVFYLINYLFAGGAPPRGCADVDGSRAIDVLDVFYLINYLFAAGPPP
jgi:hypothetical protein